MMELILGLMSITSKVTLPEGIRNASATHLQGAVSTCIVSDDPTPWLAAKLPFSIIIWNDWTIRQNQIVDGYILDIRNLNSWEVSQLDSMRRIAWTRFVLVTSKEDVSIISKMISKYGLCNAMVISETAFGTKVSIANETCSGPGQEALDVNNEGRSCYINASFMDLPPQNLYKNERLSGWEGLHLQTTADYLGMQVNWTNRHESLWAELLEDSATGRCLGGIGAVYAFHYRWLRTELIASCNPATMAFTAPLHAGPSEPTWFIILVSEMSPNVWLITFFTYLTLVMLAGLFAKPEAKDLSYQPFHVFALVLGMGQQVILQRGFTLTIIFFGFMITIYYQAVMSSKLTAPAKPAEITNWKQMIATGWSLKGNIPMKKMLASLAEAYPNDSIKQEVYRRYDPDPSPLEDMLLRVVQKRDMLFARHTTNIIFISQKDPRIAGKLHIVEEPVITFFPNTMMPKHSCLAEKFQHTYYRICGSGLASKWYKDMTAAKPSVEDTAPKKLAISHIEGFLFLLLLGYVVSVIAFVAEIVTRQVQKRYGKNENGKTKSRVIHVKSPKKL